jgi:hypothetical protein
MRGGGGFCEQGNESSDSVKGWEFLAYPSNCECLKKGCYFFTQYFDRASAKQAGFRMESVACLAPVSLVMAAELLKHMKLLDY